MKWKQYICNQKISHGVHENAGGLPEHVDVITGHARAVTKLKACAMASYARMWAYSISILNKPGGGGLLCRCLVPSVHGWYCWC